MRFPRLFGWSSLLFAVAALTAGALAQPPIADKEYKLINPPQRTETGKKIEVIEFFSYACPHCADFEPFLQDWLKRKPKDVEYRMVPMVFRESWKPLAKLYFTLEQMALVDKYHMKVYDALHKQNQQLFTDQAVMDWVLKQGIDKAKFEQTYHSFGIDTKVQRAAAMGRAYGVQFTPSLAVNGKYWTGPSMVMSPNGGLDIPRFFEVVERLVAMERGKPAAAGGTKEKS
jgi:thiol:disulfide interchange protein DsbA